MNPSNGKDANVNYSLHHSENYHDELETDISSVAAKIAHLFVEYLKCIRVNLQLKNKNLASFIVLRGLDTIANVFNLLLLYTKNINVTYYHCQKAFYYYIEFVGQISEDEKQFLQLTSRDATSYVYKKTIFDIPNDMKRDAEELSVSTKSKLHCIHTHILLYKLLVSKLAYDTEDSDALQILEKVFDKFHTIQEIHELYIIANKLVFQIEDSRLLYTTLLTIGKKAKKNPEIIENIKQKIASEEFIDKLATHPDKFIHWLMH